MQRAGLGRAARSSQVHLASGEIIARGKLLHNSGRAVARAAAAEHGQILRHLLEGSIFIAGGVCVLSVAAQQLYCWRTHRKDGGLLSGLRGGRKARHGAKVVTPGRTSAENNLPVFKQIPAFVANHFDFQ